MPNPSSAPAPDPALVEPRVLNHQFDMSAMRAFIIRLSAGFEHGTVGSHFHTGFRSPARAGERIVVGQDGSIRSSLRAEDVVALLKGRAGTPGPLDITLSGGIITIAEKLPAGVWAAVNFKLHVGSSR
jgi:hypothetical protein